MKSLRWLIFAIPLALAWSAAGSAEASYPVTCSYKPCKCPQVYDPVCGMDGNTYGNSCEADCACMPIAYEGECDDDCTKECDGTKLDPVCGKDGETYGNECYAKCLGVDVAHDGACKPWITPGN